MRDTLLNIMMPTSVIYVIMMSRRKKYNCFHITQKEVSSKVNDSKMMDDVVVTQTSFDVMT